jgi:hypothetical protein
MTLSEVTLHTEAVIPGLVVGEEAAGHAQIGLSAEPVTATVRPDGSWVRGFCAIIDDRNPKYMPPTGDDVPPAMLLSLLMPPLWAAGDAAPVPPPLCVRVPLPGDKVLNSKQSARFYRPIKMGQLLSMQEKLVDISPLKTTVVGTGHFVTTEATFTDEAGNVAAVLTNVLFRYRQDGGQA